MDTEKASNWAIQFSVNDVKICGLVTRGCPQEGRALSPLRGNIVLESLISPLINIDKIYTIAYTDILIFLQTERYESLPLRHRANRFLYYRNTV